MPRSRRKRSSEVLERFSSLRCGRGYMILNAVLMAVPRLFWMMLRACLTKRKQLSGKYLVQEIVTQKVQRLYKSNLILPTPKQSHLDHLTESKRHTTAMNIIDSKTCIQTGSRIRHTFKATNLQRDILLTPRLSKQRNFQYKLPDMILLTSLMPNILTMPLVLFITNQRTVLCQF